MQDQQQETLDKVKQWLRVRIEHEHTTDEVKRDWQQLIHDIDHSALLRRLLDGKQPLEEAPPLAYSYPWYSLVEKGRADGGFEVNLYPHGIPTLAGPLTGDEPLVVIAQSIWRIAETIEEGEEYIVSWSETGLHCRLTKTREQREDEWENTPMDREAWSRLSTQLQEETKESWWAHNSWTLEVLSTRKQREQAAEMQSQFAPDTVMPAASRPSPRPLPPGRMPATPSPGVVAYDATTGLEPWSFLSFFGLRRRRAR